MIDLQTEVEKKMAPEKSVLNEVAIVWRWSLHKICWFFSLIVTLITVESLLFVNT